MSRAKPYRFDLSDIAKLVGKGVEAVRTDKNRKKFNPHNLKSLVSYIGGNILLQNAYEQKPNKEQKTIKKEEEILPFD